MLIYLDILLTCK